jgi:hypothetical protein
LICFFRDDEREGGRERERKVHGVVVISGTEKPQLVGAGLHLSFVFFNVGFPLFLLF